MSGPIVRKYGFANFEKIFGEKPLEHGIDRKSDSPDVGTGLPADLDHSGKPVDPASAEAAGKIEPSTEFGNAVE
jgi:hypothetical protein